VTGTLATIAEEVRAAGLRAPAVTVVGEVARLRERLRWFDARPLSGTRVLVTRTREQASELSRLLELQGAEPIELPTIEIAETANGVAVTAVIEGLRTSAYQWVIFTSANGIGVFLRHLRERGYDVRAFGRAQIAAIGPGTADALARAGLVADLVPERYVAEGLLEAFAARAVAGQRFLLPRAEGARDTLIEGLEARGAWADELTLYRAAVPVNPDVEGLRRLREGGIDVVTFASSSAVRNLVEMLGGDIAPLRSVRIAAIGPVTAEAVRTVSPTASGEASGSRLARGLEVWVEAGEYTVAGLVEAIVESTKS
jgi:uroporphyrinogen III methyltransferase/synthase